jgi:hypothetical protein
MLYGKKCIDQNRIAFAINQRDGIGYPGKIFLPGRNAFGNTSALLGQ